MVTFESVLRSLEGYGLLDVIIPFFLIFTIAFAVLQRSNILGDSSATDGQNVKTYNVVLSTILGLIVVIPHVLGKYPAGKDVVVIINSSLPSIAAVIVALIMVLLLVGVFGGSTSFVGGATGVVAILAFAIVTYIFGSSAGWWNNIYLDNVLDPDTQALLIVIGVFALIIWFITKKPSQPRTDGEKGALGNALGELGKLFGGQ